MNKKKIEASIIIPTKDDITRLSLTLKALSLQTNKNFEIIIIFDDSKSETILDFKKRHFDLNIKMIMSSPPHGRSAARNNGLKISESDFIIFLDADCIPCEDFVEKHLLSYSHGTVTLGIRKRFFSSESQLIALESQFDKYNGFQKIENDAIIEKFDFFIDLYLSHKLSPLRWLGFYTNNISFSKSDLKEPVFFDENFRGWGWEDIDFGITLAQQGLKFFRNKSIINYHIDHPTNLDICIIDEQNNYRYIFKKYKKNIGLKLCIFYNHIMCSFSMRIINFLQKIYRKKQNYKLQLNND